MIESIAIQFFVHLEAISHFTFEQNFIVLQSYLYPTWVPNQCFQNWPQEIESIVHIASVQFPIASQVTLNDIGKISQYQTQTTWWRHQMETFSALLALCAGNSPVPGEFHTQRPVTRSFDVYLICTQINGWVNNREAGDSRRHRAHYDVIVMKTKASASWIMYGMLILQVNIKLTLGFTTSHSCRIMFFVCMFTAALRPPRARIEIPPPLKPELPDILWSWRDPSETFTFARFLAARHQQTAACNSAYV